MAAEASRSSGGSVDTYIGSLISLTSKSEIRYEGILFNINTDDASIGLRNVRSFGTEGRRKDGPQVPASDKVYEYIVFRGSDIKDLQVKSSLPVPPAPPAPNDPAIIQSHYVAPTLPSSLPTSSASACASASVSTATGPLVDFSTPLPQSGLPRPTYHNGVPLYQPGGGLGSWNPSNPPATNGSGLSVPMYWQGYHGPSGAFQAQQQPMVQPIQGLPMPPSMQQSSMQSMQQPAQYPSMTSSLPTGSSMEFPPSLLQPISSGAVSMPSNVLPVQSSASLVPDLSTTNMMLSMGASQVVPPSSSSLLSQAPPNVLDKSGAASLVSNQAKPISSSSLPFNNNLSEPFSTLGGTSSSPALVTPGQFLQPGPTTSQTLQTAQKDVEVVQVSSLAPQLQAPATTIATTAPVRPETQPPLLPLPSPSNSKMNGVSSQSRYVSRGGHGRGRANEFARHPTNFTEDFDFEAMNEKFKKDEVWGHLGKTKSVADDVIDSQDEDEVDHSKIDVKPVYKKDDFFDTISCNALDHESRERRPRFSEQMKLDTETFGDFPRNRGFRGGRGTGRGGRSRGGYYGRGFGYVGRGRGHNIYRAI